MHSSQRLCRLAASGTRDYLSSFMKIGVFVALIAGVFVVNPSIQMPPLQNSSTEEVLS